MEDDVIEVAVQRLLVTLEGVDQRLVPLLEFWQKARQVRDRAPGDRFVAITDPGTPLAKDAHTHAREHQEMRPVVRASEDITTYLGRETAAPHARAHLISRCVTSHPYLSVGSSDLPSACVGLRRAVNSCFTMTSADCETSTMIASDGSSNASNWLARMSAFM